MSFQINNRVRVSDSGIRMLQNTGSYESLPVWASNQIEGKVLARRIQLGRVIEVEVQFSRDTTVKLSTDVLEDLDV